MLWAGRTLSYARLWSQPGAVTYVLEPLTLLLLYAALAVWATVGMPARATAGALRRGSRVGVLAGGCGA